jgi:CheY-like chemotaxis protein
MTAKRALVVDDSRSARAFLGRILERHDLIVDSAESAEEAIEYLKRQRPDVIFMDHLMPGMDGFQAVQAIKNDPRTATIPILMYTSQEGELYLSQARALGALGVLPKQTRPADVTKALVQLNLVGGETSTAITGPLPTLTPEAMSLSATAEQRLISLTPEIRELIGAMLSNHTAEMRRFVVEHLESHADRIIGDVRLMLKDDAGPPTLPAPPAAPDSAHSGRARWLPAISVVALLLAIALATLWYRAVDTQQQLGAQLSSAQSSLAAVQQRLSLANESVHPPGADAAAAASTVLIEPVPYGEPPLAQARVEKLQSQLEQLIAQGFRGRVQITSFPGRFCVTGSGETPVLADAATLFSKCNDSNGVQQGSSLTPRESLAFANMLAALRLRARDSLDIRIQTGGADEVASAYPAITDTLTAGEWNRVATQNNRVEMRWSAAP